MNPRTAEAFARDETYLVGHAKKLTADQLGQVIEFWLSRHDPDGAEPRIEGDTDRFYLSKTLDGRLKGDFDLGGDLATTVERVIDEAVSQILAKNKKNRETDATDPGLDHTASQRRARTLGLVCERAAASPKNPAKRQPLFTVHTTVDTLAERGDPADWLLQVEHAWTAPIPLPETHLWACDCWMNEIVIRKQDGEPLDAGRATGPISRRIPSVDGYPDENEETVVIVFVHGVPETAAIWRKVRAAIDAESTALALPGFGTPRPDGFAATKDAYVDWLLGELDAIDDPIDLVGHDWGAGLTYRVATAHGDRIRSWVADVGNIAHPDYEWHDFAKMWQTPGEGEEFVAAQNAQAPEERAAGFEMVFGLSATDALEMARGSDATMGQCILDLYRSATPNVHADWGPWAPTTAPGLVIHPTEDPFSDESKAPEVAEALGAEFAPLEDAGHFWPYQTPEAAAALLSDFWSRL